MTTTNFRRAPPVEDCLQLPFAALLERFPQLREGLRGEWDDEDDDSDWLSRYEGEQVLLIEGDAELDAAWLQSVADAGIDRVAVTGDASVDSPTDALLYVGGDLHCHIWEVSNEPSLVVDGRILARDCVVFFAEDDETTCQPRPARIETPWLFSWFYSVSPLRLSPGTAVFILADHAYGQSLKQTLPNPVINWHEAIHVLRDELQYLVEADWHDMHSWRLDAIREALASGRPVLREGVSLAALPICQRADDLARIGERRAAYLQLRSAAAIAPGLYRVHERMGDLLFEAGAYEQALACALRAVALFPQCQTALADGAMNDAALAALRAHRFDDAIDMATRSLARHSSAELVKVRAIAHRLRGEALLRRGDADAARRDLEAAIELNPRQNGARWMLGLWHHMHGDARRAHELHDAAAHGDAKFAGTYDVHRDTDFLHAPPTRVDWDESELAAEAPAAADEGFWLRLIQASGPGELARVPAELRTQALCVAAVHAAPAGRADFAAAIPPDVFTPDMALELAQRGAANLELIPPALIDKALCLATPPEHGGFALAHVPPSLIDTELCHEAVERHVYDIDQVPPVFRTEDLYVSAIAHGGRYYVDNALPRRWHTPSMFKRAIALRKAALDGIPGKDFNAELFAHAQTLYGQDTDWPAIVERHGQEACRRDEHGDAAEQCWRVFWDEPFMLEQIARDGYHLAPYEIPEALFTPAIAEACHRRDAIHLDRIPRAFVTDAMCERFILEFADELRKVPVSRRSLKVCVIAVAHERAQLAAVPAARHAEVMVALLGDADAAVPWMRLERARGELMRATPDSARAEADLRAAIDMHDEGDDAAELRNESTYLLGWCAWRRGDMAAAESLRRASGHEDDWPDYESFNPAAGKHTADFDDHHFDRTMHEVDHAIESGDLDAAWQSALDAQRLLADAGVQEPVAWAQLLDKQRWLSFERGQLDLNVSLCRDVLARLGAVTLWPYLRGHDAVRHALRAALHRLAMLTLEADPPASLSALHEARQQLRRLWSLRGPLEDEKVLDAFRDGREALHARIAELEAVV